MLPEDVRRAVHEGLLANDVVGFHTDRWRRNFVQSCVAITGAEWDPERECLVHDGRRTHVVVRPIGIDPDEFEALGSTRRCSRRSARSSRRGPRC